MHTTFRVNSTPIVANDSTTIVLGGSANRSTKHTFQIIPDIGTTELVPTGNFTTDTGWTKDPAWTISDGVATCDGTQTVDALLTLTVPVVTVADTVYLLQFDTTVVSDGFVAAQFDGVEVIGDNNTVNTFRTLVTAADIAGEIDIVADADFVGSIDNVSLTAIATTGIVTVSGKVDSQNPLSTFATIGSIDLSATSLLFWQGSFEEIQFSAGATLNGSITVTSTSTR